MPCPWGPGPCGTPASPTAPSQQGRSRDGAPGRPRRSQELAREAGRRGLLLSGDIPQPGPAPGADFPRTSCPRAEPERTHGGGCACLAQPEARTRPGVLLAVRPAQCGRVLGCWWTPVPGFLAGAGQPPGSGPVQSALPPSSQQPRALDSRVPRVQVGKLRHRAVSALPRLRRHWGGVQPVGVLPGTTFGPVPAACSRVPSSEPLKAARLQVTLSGPLTNLKAWPLTRGEDP